MTICKMQVLNGQVDFLNNTQHANFCFICCHCVLEQLHYNAKLFELHFKVTKYRVITDVTIGSLHQQGAFCINHELFSCAPGVSNEARFVFTVQSIIMPQKLKGTLTFIVKVSRETHTHTRLQTYNTIKGIIIFFFYILDNMHTVLLC